MAEGEAPNTKNLNRQSTRHMKTSRRRPSPIKRESDDSEDWLVTYSDAITLLLCFFVILINFSKINLPVFDEIAAGLKSELGKRDVVAPIAQLESAVEQMLSDLQIHREDTIKQDDVGLVIEFQTSDLFDLSTGRISQNGQLALDEIILTTLRPGYENYEFKVYSHVNPGAPPSGFDSNWLATGFRAAEVLRVFELNNIEAHRLQAIAAAEGSPKAIEVPEGVDPATISPPDNDRIVIRIHPPLDEGGGGGSFIPRNQQADAGS